MGQDIVLPPKTAAAFQIYLNDTNNLENARDAALQFLDFPHWEPSTTWEASAAMAGRVLELGGDTLQDLLVFGYTLAMAGDLDNSRAISRTLSGPLAKIDADQQKALGIFGDSPPFRMYSAAAWAFAAGRYSQAETILDLLLPYEMFGRRMLGLDIPVDDIARPATLDDDVVADFILQTIEGSINGRFTVPRMELSRAEYEAAFARYRGRRVLIIHRERYYPKPSSEQAPFADYLLETATNVGLEARLIRSDPACAPAANTIRSENSKALQEIRRTIETWQPEVIVYDNFGGNGTDLFTEEICDLRLRYDFKLVGAYSDAWNQQVRSKIHRIKVNLDAVWIWDAIDTTGNLEFQIPTVSTVPPMSEAPFAAARGRVSPTIDLGFIGTINGHNYIRGLWMIEARRRGIPLEIEIGFPEPQTKYKNNEGLADFIASCKSSLCICGRNIRDDAVPGRVWESILSMSVILQDNGKQLRSFLVPFAHYIPFQTVDELGFYSGFLARREDIRHAIAAHALSFVQETYPSVRAWLGVMETADGRAANLANRDYAWRQADAV